MNIRRHKRLLLTIFIFGVAFVIGFILLSYLLRPVTNNRRIICGYYAEENTDVVFVGGSDCYTAWQPLRAWEEYGFTSYNYAIDALQPQVIKYMLEEVRKEQTPELYVIDLRPFTYGDLISHQEGIRNIERVAPFRNFADNIKYSQNRYELIRNCAPEAEGEWTYHFDIAKYHNALNGIITGENWQYIFNEKKSVSRGFYPYDRSNPIELFETGGIEEEQILVDYIDELFIDLLDYCKDNKLQVIFLVYPYSGQAATQQKYNYMERKVSEYGFDYLDISDYLDEIALDVSVDFYDIDHLSLLGSDKVSDFIGGYIDARYDLPDNRSNAEYAEWNEDYTIWNIEMEQIRTKMQNNNK